MEKTKVILTDDKVYVSHGGGEMIVSSKNNAWLWLLGAIRDGAPITIKDERTEIQDHQHRLDM